MSDRAHSVEELFEAALDLPQSYRAAYLDRACAGSPELRLEIEELLRDHDRMGDFLAEPLLVRPSSSADIKPPAIPNTFGRYLILTPLGAGGMGVVYRARDEKLERDVAVKTFSPGTLSSDEARSRFRKEALALAKLSHAHIAAVYDVGQQDDIDYIVMELVPGESLAVKLKSGPLPVREAAAIALQIAQALEEAHEQGVIHRDLKPANVMLTPKAQTKVLDFGLAKLLSTGDTDATVTVAETRGILGTPRYMSPEQAHGKPLDVRTDIWSLGVIFYELLTGTPPFTGDSSMSVMHAIVAETPKPLRQLRPDAPALAEQIVSRALQKDTAARYQTASAFAHDLSTLLNDLSENTQTRKRSSRWLVVGTAAVLILAAILGGFLYRRSSQRRWGREEAIPQINDLLAQHKHLAASLLLQKALRYTPNNPALQQLDQQNSDTLSISSSPAGATVEIKDYVSPDQPWHRLGVTPLTNVKLPTGYFRWKLSKPGLPDLVAAPLTDNQMSFALDDAGKAPPGMNLASGGRWRNMIAFVGWVGPYNLPPYYIDRYEVTNADYQKFIDSGGYTKPQYWQQDILHDGRKISFEEAMALFRDTTGRPGPSTWAGGHYPDGAANLPVTGVSWFEASAYAAFVGKQLPVLAQWFEAAPADAASSAVLASNISGSALAPVGSFPSLGPFGTYDMVGNAREWTANAVGENLRFLLGGSWRSQSYLSSNPEALTPFDRSDANGFRCVRNIQPLPPDAALPVKPIVRDFAHFKPVSDDVFKAYQILYAYPKNAPLDARSEGIVNETADWREEKVTFNAAYNGERMAAYLFLPKHVQPPYQTVLFFPSARVDDLRDSRRLGDIRFFDYIVQSGRAVMYPIYQGSYERSSEHYQLPGASQRLGLTIEWYKDAARSLDYLNTRPDIDSNNLAYLGVSKGSAFGVIAATLLQDRLKTAVFLDGGYFLDPPPSGGDQADFVPRLKKPVLMVNGRYDFTFSLREAQEPFFAMLGAPSAEKSHVLLDTPHDVTQQRPQLIKTVLDWLDKYLGRVTN